MRRQGDAPLQFQIDLLEQRLQIDQGRMVQVGCRIPAVRQIPGSWHVAVQEPQPVAPVSEIRHGDDLPGRDLAHRRQHEIGPQHGLQGAAEHDHVVRVGREHAELAVDVELDQRNPPLDRAEHLIGTAFDPGAGAGAAANQPAEQLSVATTQVEYPRPGRDVAGDHRQVITQLHRLTHARPHAVPS